MFFYIAFLEKYSSNILNFLDQNRKLKHLISEKEALESPPREDFKVYAKAFLMSHLYPPFYFM